MTDDQPVDTGFDDVAAGHIYPPAEVVTATVTALDANAAIAFLPTPLPKLDAPTLAQLAREVAMNIRERSTILRDFNLTDEHYAFLETYHEFYKHALKAACIEWHAPLNTQERIKVEAAAILEDSLVGLGARMQNRAEGLPGVVEVAKLFAKVAGVGELDGSNAAPGERFTINIDLGGDTKTVTVAAPAPQVAAPQPPSISLGPPEQSEA